MNILARLERTCEELRQIVEDAKATRDPFAALVLQSRRDLKLAMDRDKKGTKHFDDAFHGSYRRAQDLGYRGTPAEWRRVLAPGVLWLPER